MAESLTYPHDYRLLFEGDVRPLIVGGQAVNLWAITYLQPGESTDVQYGSHDLDILREDKVLKLLRTLPDWKVEVAEMRSTRAFSTAPDGRKLLIEVLPFVHGLDSKELQAAEAGLQYLNTEYRLLDPIAMLQAKAANVLDLKQDGDPPRHDRDHLKLIARCMPRFIQEVHEAAVDLTATPQTIDRAVEVVGRAVKVFKNAKIRETLRATGIDPSSIIPEVLRTSPIKKIQNTYKWQIEDVTKADRISPNKQQEGR